MYFSLYITMLKAMIKVVYVMTVQSYIMYVD